MLEVNVVCRLVDENKSSIRAALVRNGAVSVLSSYANCDNASGALYTLSKYKYTHVDICSNIGMMLDKLEGGASRLTANYAICIFYNCLPTLLPMLTAFGSLHEKTILVLLKIHHGIQNMGALLDCIIRVRPQNVHEIVSSSDFGKKYCRENADLYCILAKHCPTIVATRLGKCLIRDVCARNVKMLNTLQICFHKMQADCYTDLMIDCILDSTDAEPKFTIAKLVLQFIQTTPSLSSAIVSNVRWSEFASYLVDRMENAQSSMCFLAPAILLQLALQKWLDPPFMGRLSAHLRSHPQKFSFTPTENIEALRSIVNTAKTLNLPQSVFNQYQEALSAQETLLQRHRKMTELGLDEFMNPHAFQCPITMEPMKDPVVASDGHTYERSSLEKLLTMDDHRSPLTRELLDTRTIIPNINLRKRIREYDDDICNIVEKVKAQKNK